MRLRQPERKRESCRFDAKEKKSYQPKKETKAKFTSFGASFRPAESAAPKSATNPTNEIKLVVTKNKSDKFFDSLALSSESADEKAK